LKRPSGQQYLGVNIGGLNLGEGDDGDTLLELALLKELGGNLLIGDNHKVEHATGTHLKGGGGVEIFLGDGNEVGNETPDVLTVESGGRIAEGELELRELRGQVVTFLVVGEKVIRVGSQTRRKGEQSLYGAKSSNNLFLSGLALGELGFLFRRELQGCEFLLSGGDGLLGFFQGPLNVAIFLLHLLGLRLQLFEGGGEVTKLEFCLLSLGSDGRRLVLGLLELLNKALLAITGGQPGGKGFQEVLALLGLLRLGIIRLLQLLEGNLLLGNFGLLLLARFEQLGRKK